MGSKKILCVTKLSKELIKPKPKSEINLKQSPRVPVLQLESENVELREKFINRIRMTKMINGMSHY